MKIFELFATLGLDTSGFEKGVKGAQGVVKKLANTVAKATKGVGNGVVSVGKTVASAAGNIINTMESAVKTIGVAGSGAIMALGVQAVQAAADIAAENAAFSATFGEMADEAKSAYAVIGNSANILDSRLQKTATKGFSQLKGAGLSANDALDASARLLTLAADGAAYYDTSLENVDERLRSFLRGNVEAGDSIGLFTSEMQRNTKAQELYKKKWDKLTEAQRQMVMLNIAEEIYKQSGVIGQASREAEGWANVIENLKEAWRQAIGVIGMPIMDNLTPVIQGITTYLAEHKDELAVFSEDLGKIINMLTMGRESEAIDSASELISGFIAGLNTYLQDGSLIEKGNEIIDALRHGFKRGIAEFSNTVELLGLPIAIAITNLKADLLVAGLDLLGALAEGFSKGETDISEAVSGVVQRVALAIEENAPKMVAGAGALIKGLADGLTKEESLTSIGNAIISTMDAIIEWIATPGNTAALTEALISMLQTVFTSAIESIVADPMGLIYGLLSPIFTVIDSLTGEFLGLQELLDSAYATWKDMNGEGEIEGTGLAEQIGETTNAAKTLDGSMVDLTTTFEQAGETFGGAAGSFGEATQAAETLNGTINNIESSEAQLKEQVDETTQAIMNMFPSVKPDNVIGRLGAVELAMSGVIAKAAATAAAISAVFSQGFSVNALYSAGHFATGLERVPYDGFPALLHKDEMVLNKNEANDYRKNGGESGQNSVNVTQYIQAVPQTASELAFQTMNALEMLRFA